MVESVNEFDLIKKYFAPLSPQGLDNDAAVLEIPAGHDLIVTSDTLNAGTHFFADAAPRAIAQKSLRVNLSDLAAMGADPLSYQLCIAFPGRPEEDWAAEFSAALAEDQKRFGIFCSGGDTTRIDGPLSISITALGTLPHGTALTRAGAKPGDQIVLTGPVGDAWAGLQIARRMLQAEETEFFLERQRAPQNLRTDIAKSTRRYARAAIDISDGLVADLGHICAASCCGARIETAAGIFSPQARALLASGAVSEEDLLTGGDDYVLALAVAPENLEALKKELPVDCAVIGEFIETPAELQVLGAQGRRLSFQNAGWTHF